MGTKAICTSARSERDLWERAEKEPTLAWALDKALGFAANDVSATRRYVGDSEMVSPRLLCHSRREVEPRSIGFLIRRFSMSLWAC